ncbi:MAG: hypothetical protein Q8Q08_02505 [Candidatus Omnitrophota bacterium]|nr:hypothetical protein [Candidatus Omnitrophota bacterium]MDZ4243023.1 hypothetical protein [Candidatus Omnitrophota bacterium]
MNNPFLTDKKPLAPGQNEREGSRLQRPRPRILLLDPDTAVCRELKYLFSWDGCETVAVTSREALREEIRKVNPHVVVLKNFPPEIDAWELSNRINDVPVMTGTPVVIYQNIGQFIGRSEGPEDPPRRKIFALNAEGYELVRQVRELLLSRGACDA